MAETEPSAADRLIDAILAGSGPRSVSAPASQEFLAVMGTDGTMSFEKNPNYQGKATEVDRIVVNGKVFERTATGGYVLKLDASDTPDPGAAGRTQSLTDNTVANTNQTREQTAALQQERQQKERNQAAGRGYYTDKELEDRSLAGQRVANEGRGLDISERNASVNEAQARLAARRLELEQIVQGDSSKLDWAKLEYQKEKDNLDFQIRERDSALSERQQGETERANTAAEKYRQDSLAGTAEQNRLNREAQAEQARLQSQTSLATEASRAMTASLPFIAPRGTSEDLAALRNSFSTNTAPPATPARSTPFPFDPRMIAQQVMAMGNGQFMAPQAPVPGLPKPPGVM